MSSYFPGFPPTRGGGLFGAALPVLPLLGPLRSFALFGVAMTGDMRDLLLR